mgnify:CR=1 FL=1
MGKIRRLIIYSDKITKSKKILSQWVLWPQYIPVDWNGQNIGNMLFIEPEKWLSPDVYNFQNQLSNQAESDTWISKLTQWVWDPNMTTASEATIAQENANVNNSGLTSTDVQGAMEELYAEAIRAITRYSGNYEEEEENE